MSCLLTIFKVSGSYGKVDQQSRAKVIPNLNLTLGRLRRVHYRPVFRDVCGEEHSAIQERSFLP